MSVSVATLITRLLPALNATSLADAQFWTEASLYEWADEAAQCLARTAPVFVVRDAATSVQAGVAVYANPARHVKLIHLALAGARLAPSASRELIALSDTWMTDAGTPARWIGDWMGHDYYRLHPTPDTAAGVIETVLAQFPPALTVSTPTLAAPLVVADYLECRMLAEARRQEGDGAMPDVADAFDKRATLYEAIFTAYWGQA